jgi:hypothetical protein
MIGISRSYGGGPPAKKVMGIDLTSARLARPAKKGGALPTFQLNKKITLDIQSLFFIPHFRRHSELNFFKQKKKLSSSDETGEKKKVFTRSSRLLLYTHLFGLCVCSERKREKRD